MDFFEWWWFPIPSADPKLSLATLSGVRCGIPTITAVARTKVHCGDHVYGLRAQLSNLGGVWLRGVLAPPAAGFH